MNLQLCINTTRLTNLPCGNDEGGHLPTTDPTMPPAKIADDDKLTLTSKIIISRSFYVK